MIKDKIIKMLRGYHGISHGFWAGAPLVTSSGCRFEPTCAEYSAMAVERYGVFQGLTKGFFRVLKCNPLTKPRADLP